MPRGLEAQGDSGELREIGICRDDGICGGERLSDEGRWVKLQEVGFRSMVRESD